MAEVTLSSFIVLGVALFMLLNSAAIAVYAERRVAAFIQNRMGPNRVGPAGLLQPIADVLKLLLKEDVTPTEGNKFIHAVAPMIPVITALMTVAVIPFGEGLYATNINASVLYLLAVASLGVYGVTLAGWASNSKYSLLGGLRAAAQMISYELPLGMAVASVVIFVGSLRVVDIAAYQETWWFFFLNPLGAIIFIIAAFAESNRTPFDLVEAEQELVGGFHTEYSSMKFGMFFLAEYMHVVINSMLMTTFFFGAYHLPFAGYWLPELSPLVKGILDVSVFTIKTGFFMFLFIWVRWTIPRFKYNQVMKLGWSRLLPLSIANFIVIAAILFFIVN
ncbi:NADH-quinone oxidoreductase subunit NuoH [Rhodohalobacter sulfatireducens]|uniref:NADH-quinone oxidoreductase subunit H n=1 Tax=Rhodohalobacter sulfatireducens TaxID=2911366 RepID=A0ABS9KF33_9BACT|nr:NADH-quinone oxidoreductase subunit NuoH [Rhodohalobacter sulfatireducens]MCG2589472.1 NADH-quinone oxidoreductase subunit NuoH [Rhodohalobacter sulfatireducens]MDR9363754.1 NADH-quinone oxidoreductase subunit NuoH [Balneolaceae bacterium]MDR9409077.1 NADH-quinone oxidoreductase subunit NuoH [Balneolaceae bacterium]